jgi:hypothetical protein
MPALALIYLIGAGIIWLAFAHFAEKEPTAHGQDILVPLGCALGLLWPLALAYLVLASPFIAYTALKSRGER